MRPDLKEHSLTTADAGFRSEANLQQLAALSVNALIADKDMRKRDERFATQARHQDKPNPLHNKARMKSSPTVFHPSDFTYDAKARTCVCPAGKSLYRQGKDVVTKGLVSEQLRGTKRDCAPCELRAKCLRTPDTTRGRIKVAAQWKLFCLVHNIEKLAHSGYAA